MTSIVPLINDVYSSIDKWQIAPLDPFILLNMWEILRFLKKRQMLEFSFSAPPAEYKELTVFNSLGLLTCFQRFVLGLNCFYM